tara:strand:- start:196 stop:348 length:153 start_codon:yes stop_codon:yes gene_type:complete
MCEEEEEEEEEETFAEQLGQSAAPARVEGRRIMVEKKKRFAFSKEYTIRR